MSLDTNNTSFEIKNYDSSNSINKWRSSKPSSMSIGKSSFAISWSRPVRVIIFVWFLLLSMIVDIDSGIISANSNVIKKDLNISYSQYGLFASISFTGRIIGTVLFMLVMIGNNRKYIIVISIFFHGVSQFGYWISDNFVFILLLRMFTAIMKVFANSYFSIWIDQFGIKKYKTLMWTVMYMTTPYGQVWGFSIGTLLFPDKWKVSFAIIGCIILLFSFVFLLIPSKYFSSKYMFIGHEDEKLVATQTESVRSSLFGDYEYKNINCYAASGSNLITKPSTKDYTVDYFKKIYSLISSGTFLFSSLTRANMFFVFQIVHLFMKDYAINGLNITDEKQLLYYYSLCSIVGPALGSLTGGLISNKFGGYESNKSITTIIFFGILTCIVVIPFTESRSLLSFSLSEFAFFYCMSAILPTISGYTISATPKHLKCIGSSIDLLITTWFGKLPGPIFYGLIQDTYNNNQLAWKICLYYYYIGFGFMILACLCKRNQSETNEYKNWGYVEESCVINLINRKKKKTRKASYVEKRGKYLAEFGTGDKIELMKIKKPIPVSK